MAAWLALLTAARYLVSDLVTAWSLPKSDIAPQTAYDDNPFHTRKGGCLAWRITSMKTGELGGIKP